MKLPPIPKRRARIELIPLIDVVFLLLVFFIYSFMSMSQHRIIPVQVPDAETGTASADGTLIIAVLPDGTTMVDDQLISREELALILKEAEHSGRGVYIAGDSEARYADIMQVCDLIRRMGITDFAFQVTGSE